MSVRIGLVGLDSSHAEDFLRHLNLERRHPELRITALGGGDGARLDELRALDPELAACATLDLLIRDVDAVIVGHRDGALHRAAAIACLEAGRAVFVDKPFANSRRDAEAIISAAEAANAPLLSGSALRWQAETRRIKARLAGIDGPINLRAWGTWYPENDYGGAIFYAIHTIELALELLGPGIADVRLRAGGEPVITYRSGNSNVMLSFHAPGQSGQSDFGVEVAAKDVSFRQTIPLSNDYMLPVVEQFAAMLRTGISPMRREELLAPLLLMGRIEALLAGA